MGSFRCEDARPLLALIAGLSEGTCRLPSRELLELCQNKAVVCYNLRGPSKSAKLWKKVAEEEKKEHGEGKKKLLSFETLDSLDWVASRDS
jgi:hypothetical protein